MFDHILGNDHVKEYLSRTLQKNTLGQSLLFAGPEGIGKSLFANAVADHLLGGTKGDLHPDLHIYRPEGKVGMHTIESMRRFSEEVYMAPFQADYKVFLIQEAHRMLPTSSNALLKTFEEPAENAVVILLTSSPASLLPTVLSRCRAIHFHLLANAQVTEYLVKNCGVSPEQASTVALQARGSLGVAMRLLRGGNSFLQEKLVEILVTGGFPTYKRLAEAAKELATKIESLKEEVETELRALRMTGGFAETSAVTKQGIEKEVEGAVTLYVQDQMKGAFDLILSWFRDIELVRAGGRKELLSNPSNAELITEVASRRGQNSLESVQKVVREVNLALERSTALHLCFESLFLKLDLLRV